MAKHRNRRRGNQRRAPVATVPRRGGSSSQEKAPSAAAGSSSRPSSNGGPTSNGGPKQDGRDAMKPANGGNHHDDSGAMEPDDLTTEAERVIGLPARGERLFDNRKVLKLLKWKKTYAVGPGMANVGNTCFLNSALQCLASVPPLAQYLIEDLHTKGKGVGGDSLWAMKRLVEQVHQAKGSRAITPTYFVKKMSAFIPGYKGNTQECSAHFLGSLIETMTECCIDRSGSRKRCLSSNRVGETTFMGSLFGGYERTQLKCGTCTYESDKYDLFSTLPLGLEVKRGEAFTLETALENNVRTEQMKGADGWECHMCNVKRDATRTTTLYKGPNVLVVHLKRFHVAAVNDTRKISKFLAFEPELTLKVTETGQSPVYDLSGVIVHDGPTLFNGHYYCYVKTSTNTWALKDDQFVRPVTLSEVLRQKAYVLVYTKRAATRTQSAELSAGNLLTRWGRGVLQRGRYRRILAAVRRLQNIVRGVLARKAFSRRLARCAAVRLQACARGRAALVVYRRQRLAATLIQDFFRGRKACAATRAQSAELSAGNLLTRWGRGVLQRGRYRRILAAVRRLQKVVRGLLARKAFSRRLARCRRAAVRLQACARGRAALVVYRRQRLAATRRKRLAATSIQAFFRGRKARRQVAVLRRAARRRQTWCRIGGLVALFMAVVMTAVAVGLLFGGPSPCLRGNTVRGGDEPLAPGSCIEGTTGSRLFGWIPGVPRVPTLAVTSDGDMVAQRPNGHTVKLTGHTPDGRSGGFLCGAERLARKLTGHAEPAYGVRSAHGKLTLGKEYFCSVYGTPAPKSIAKGVRSWLERGGRLGFSALGDLEVVGPKGDVWWSLAEDLGSEGDSRWE